jgi:hypothetical protein
MKTLSLVLLLLVLPAGADAQEPAAAKNESHGVSVVKSRWQKRVYNPALDEDPLDAARDSMRLEQQRRETQRENAVRAQLGRPQLSMPSQTAESINRAALERAPLNEPGTVYVYEVRVVNTGAKKIRSLIWEYVVLDAETQREVGRHLFETKVGIEVGKSKGLTAWSAQPPATVVDASKSDKESRGQYSERIDFQRVEYEDGTVWERGKK